MKETLRCPRCEATHVLHVRQVVSQYGELGDSYTGWKLALVARHGPAGPVEAFVCKQCGYTEFYTDPTKLPADGVHVIELEGAAAGGPYRGGPAAAARSVLVRTQGSNGLAVLEILVRECGLTIAEARKALAKLPRTFSFDSPSAAIAFHNLLTQAGAGSELR